MGTYLLTSMFPQGFGEAVAALFREKITKRDRFAFVASSFEAGHDITDHYFRVFLAMFGEAGIHFGETCVVDGRITPAQAQKAVASADVVWLAGGDTPAQFRSLQAYGLVPVLRRHNGVVIGMSAGAINLGETAVCTLASGHTRQEIYPALGCVPFSVEPHFVLRPMPQELRELSYARPLYGLCDGGVIVYENGKTACLGEVYRLHNGRATPV